MTFAVNLPAARGSGALNASGFNPLDLLIQRNANSPLPSRDLLAKATASQTDIRPKSVAGSVGQKGSHKMWVPAETDKVRLDHKLMDLKIQTATLMHRSADWRAGIFRQLDLLLDEENWEPVDELPNDASYLSAVRLLIFLKEVRRPGLGLTHDGHIVLSWSAGDDHLTIECHPGDSVRWMVSHTLPDGTRERAAGHSFAARVPAVIAAYEPGRWLSPR